MSGVVGVPTPDLLIQGHTATFGLARLAALMGSDRAVYAALPVTTLLAD